MPDCCRRMLLAGPLSWAVLIAYVASLAIAFFPESRKYSGLMELWHLELNVFRCATLTGAFCFRVHP